MKRTALLLSAAVVSLSCDSSSPIAGPEAPLMTPSLQWEDGSTTGNPHFFFLPPLVPSPSPGGTFDFSLQPRVEICASTANPCAAGDVVAEYTITSGPGGQRIRVGVQEGVEQYGVNWDSNAFPRVLDQVYRIRVFVVNLELGSLDVEFPSERSETGPGDPRQRTIDQTVFVRFRIEDGALESAAGCETDPSVECEVEQIPAEEGGMVDVMDPVTGTLAGTVMIPAGSASEDFTITVETVATPPAPPLAIPPAQQFGPFLEIETDPPGVTFTGAGATLTICQDPNLNATLPLPLHDELVVFKVDDGETTVLPTTRGAPECAGYASVPGQPGTNGIDFLRGFRNGLDRVAALLLPRQLYARSLHGGLNTILRNFSTFGATLGANPVNSTADVPDGVIGSATTITVQTVDGLGQPITVGGETVDVSVSGANSATPAVTDNGDGTYTASYTPGSAGTDLVDIALNGSSLAGSPFTSIVGTVTVRVCSTAGGGLPTFPTLTAGVAAVPAGGTVQVCAGTHDAAGMVIDKGLTLEPEAGASVTIQDRMTISNPTGTVTVRGFTIDNPTVQAVLVRTPYADVVLEDLTFQGTGASINTSTVPTAHVTVRESSFFGNGSTRGLSVSNAPSVDIWDNYFEDQRGNSNLQFQSGSNGTILRNDFDGCARRGCIRVVLAGTVLITDNTIRTTQRAAELGGTGVTGGLVADGDDVTAERNLIEGIGAPGDPDDPNTYAINGLGGLTAWYGLGSTTLRDNVVRNAGIGIGGFAQTLVATDNIVEDTHTGIQLSSSLTSVDVMQNDFTDYLVSIDTRGVPGPVIPDGTMTCNWWGDVSGPQNPMGVAAGVYTPFATAPIATTGRPC